MKPDISEFSFGYALTEDLIRWNGRPLTAAPVFPSLIKEGRAGGGHDVRLDFKGIPLFLQFKLSHFMKRGNATEFQYGLFNSPYYRMLLRPLRHSDQHNLLLELEYKGHEVYYVAPEFHLVAELNEAYVNQDVINRSVFIPPSAIGKLPDDKDHHVAFQSRGNAYLLSEPTQIEFVTGKFFSERVYSRLRERLSDSYYLGDLIVPLSNQMLEIIRERRSIQELDLGIFSDLLPIQRVSYLARMFFNCEMFVVSQK